MTKYKHEVDKVSEFWKARNDKLGTKDAPDIPLATNLFVEETNEVLEALDNSRPAHEILKELCDAVYVLHAITMAYGLEDVFVPAFNIVHQNNMDKIANGTVNEHGKLVKPVDHPSVLPELRKLIDGVS